MDDECLCLTWNNHGATYQQMLNHLRIENILTDCTLACDGQKFFVHRLVLVTCSDFFKSLLGDVPCQHPIVYLKGINGREMQALIDFMYLGKIDVPQKEVPNLLSTAETLQIKGLGVLKPENKDEAGGQPSCKRKRSPLSTAESLGTSSRIENLSSPLVKHGASESICSDKDYPSPKVSHRDWTRNINLSDQEFLPTSATRVIINDIYSAQTRDKVDSFNKHSGTESILGSIFKSSPLNSISASIPSSSEVALNSITNTSSYMVPTSKSSPKEGLTLAPLTPLQSHLPEHAKSSDYYGSSTGGTPDSRINGASYIDETLNPERGFENLSEVKEEALDYTRGSTIDMTENSLLSTRSRKELPPENDATNNFPKDDASHFLDNLGRNSNLQLSYRPQDENAENGIESGRPYLCPICRKSFAKVAILKRHHLAHFRPYNCHLCPRSFTRREVLAEHVLEHNGADLRLPCPVCKMTIKRKRNLQAHIKVKHPEYHKQKSANNEALC